VYELMNALLEKNYQVLVETGGGVSVEKVPERVIKILDIKCPGSGEVSKNLWGNLDHLNPHDEVKFVLADRADYEWSRKILDRTNIHKKVQVLFSPVYDRLDLKELAAWVLEDTCRCGCRPSSTKSSGGKTPSACNPPLRGGRTLKVPPLLPKKGVQIPLPLQEGGISSCHMDHLCKGLLSRT